MSNVTGYFRGNSYVTQAISTVVPGTATSISITDTWTFTFGTSGTGSDQNTLVAATTLNLLANTPQVIDLSSISDPYGNTIAFSNIHFLGIKHLGKTDQQPLTVGYSTTTANAHIGFVSNPGQFYVYPSSLTGNDGFEVKTAPNQTGVPVGGAWGRLLNFDPGGFAMNIAIYITGYFLPDVSTLAHPRFIRPNVVLGSLPHVKRHKTRIIYGNGNYGTIRRINLY